MACSEVLAILASNKQACFCASGPYDLSTKGDLVRARLTIKTQGYGFLWAGPAPAY